MSCRLPAQIRSALDATGLPWAVENAKRGQKLRLNGRLVGLLNLGGHAPHPIAERNVVAQIRRMAREAPS